MSIRVGVLTVSDRSFTGERPDQSGPAIVQVIKDMNWIIVRMEIVPDDFDLISHRLAEWSDSGEIDVLLTTGGTGFGLRDITPEATTSVIERSAPGLTEAMRSSSLRITPHAMLTRAAAGIRKNTLIINLPGSPKGVIENLNVVLPVLPHAVQLLSEDPQAESSHILAQNQQIKS